MSENDAVTEVLLYGRIYGYGNLIARLKEAWALYLKEEYQMTQKQADAGAGIVCPWCHVDERNGKRVK